MNTKMKALSLALMAVSGLALAGTAAAACPAGPTVAEGGAWSAKSTLGGSLAITTPGFAGTECKLDATLSQNLPAVNAFVRDNTPADEPRYRAQFVVNADAVSGMNTIQSVKIFGASTEAGAMGVTDLVRLTMFGNISGTQTNLGIFYACATGGLCSTTSIPLPAGENVVEIDLQSGTNGQLKVWVNNGDESAPDADVQFDNGAWGGVDFATLGLATPSAGYRSAQLNNVVQFDEFDSRRVSFIGN